MHQIRLQLGFRPQTPLGKLTARGAKGGEGKGWKGRGVEEDISLLHWLWGIDASGVSPFVRG